MTPDDVDSSRFRHAILGVPRRADPRRNAVGHREKPRIYGAATGTLRGLVAGNLF